MDKLIEELQPEDNKQFLSTFKKILGDFKQLQIKQQSCGEVLNGIAALVTFFLKCPSKFQAKRVIASFFQNCDDDNQNAIQSKLCSQLLSCFSDDLYKTDVKNVRQTVDNIHSLLENSAFGQRCLESISLETLIFLIRAEEYFLSHVSKDVPPVYLNEVMHHCLITMQTLNLVLQKTVVDKPEKMKEFSGNSKMLAKILDVDIEIIQNELLLMDCRCCCAMNVFLLIQISLPHTKSMWLIPTLLFSNAPRTEIMKAGFSLPWLSEKQDFLTMSKQTPLSFLAIAFGYIAMATPKSIIIEADLENFFFTDELLPNLLDCGNKCEDTISKTLHGKTINLWTTKLNTSISGFPMSSKMADRLQGDSLMIQSLLQYVWTHWEDQLDVIRQSAKTVFENVIKVHMASRIGETIPQGNSPSSFISSILSKIFNVSWTSRGKFSALSSCVIFVGASCLLSQRSYFPSEVLSQFQDKSLACYATELYMNTLQSHRKQLSSTLSLDDVKSTATDIKHSSKSQPNEEKFIKTWIEPVITALCSSNKNQKNNIIEYLLPRLLKSDRKFLDHILNQLSLPAEDNSNISSKHGAVVACLRRARVMGILAAFPATKKDEKSSYCVLYADVIKTTLCVLDEQMRLDAFAFLCESSKTTEAVTSSEFEMLQLFIQSNLNSQSPAFRQSFLSLLKKLFTRIKESLPPLMKLARREKLDVSEQVSSYKMFLEWIASLMLSNLHQGAAFARRTTCLASLSLMNCIFTKEADSFSISSYLDETHILTLLNCLADTYEENKVDSLSILAAHAQLNGHVTTTKRFLYLFQVSLSLACSTKPQDCGTAAYIMLLLMKQQDIFSLIKGYEIELKTNTAKEMLSKINKLFSSYPLTNIGGDAAATVQGYASIYLLHILIVYLHDQNEVAQQSLITAAANRPMYPTLQCIRYIMQEIKWQLYPNKLIFLGRHFIQLLIQTCLNLSRVVSPVVQNSSPEGNVPAEAILGPGLNMIDILPKSNANNLSTTSETSSSSHSSNLSQSILDSQMLVEAMPEYLVVCCWRSIKEVSLTLGKMCLQIPVTAIAVEEESISEENNAFLSFKTIQSVGDYFTQQLLESVHRGAFELAYAGFQLMCQMLWNHPHPDFHNLPNQWLMQVISDIKSEDPNSKLCATRRSAGVPFFIQAITSSEPFVHGRKCFHSAMKELIIFALNESENDGINNIRADAQVHALNILRALYRDSRLREDVVPYIADGVRAAIRGFKSNLWSVRNSATLLLSALMTRMFGVKRSKDETAISKKNCQTGRSFFYHYPSLYSFLLTELEEATKSIGPTNIIKLHPSLYPVLLVLGRLFPSMLEGSDTSLSLSAFIPYVLKCASSPVLKTRIIAARALQPLARRNQVVEVAKQLFVNIPFSISDRQSSFSHIHGSLLQLCELVKLVSDFNTSLQENVLHFFVHEILSRKWLLSSENQCFATRQTVLHLVDCVLNVGKLVGSLTEAEAEQLQKLKTCFTSSLSQATPKDDKWKPLVYEYERSRAVLSLRYLNELEKTSKTASEQNSSHENLDRISKQCRETVVMNFLKSTFYEVRLQILSMFITSLTESPQAEIEGETDGNKDEEKVIITSDSLGAVADTSGHTLTENIIYSSLDNETRKLMRNMAVTLFDDILEMAIQVEEHHECLEKVFFVLAYIPDCCQLLQKKDTQTVNRIFTLLLIKIENERRNEVKAAMLRFSGCFIPFLYDSIKLADTPVQYKLFTEWTHLVQDCSQAEEYPDLQISVCHILLDNAAVLLCDVHQRLELLSFHFWNILATLLQEDDLEVKDVAASILAVSSGLNKGSLHPNIALERLPETLIHVHKDKNSCDLTKFLVSWVVQDTLVDMKEQNENLFEKSEMNTYKDYIAFTRCVINALSGLFHHKVNTKNVPYSSETPGEGNYKGEFTKELQGSDLVDFLVQAFEKMEHELKILRECCQTSDAFLNPSRHISLCHAIFRAKSLISLFRDIFKNENSVQLKITELHTVVDRLMKEFNACDLFLQ